MKRIGSFGQKWLKCLHVLFCCLWVGGAVSVNLMNFFVDPLDPMQLYGIYTTMKFIDDFIIIPGAVGLLLTGLGYSLFTNWGWFKHRWITAKWIINIYGVIFGTFWLGPWLNSLPAMAREQGLQCLADPVYVHNVSMLKIWGTFQVSTIILAVIISVIKPWKRRKLS